MPVDLEKISQERTGVGKFTMVSECKLCKVWDKNNKPTYSVRLLKNNTTNECHIQKAWSWTTTDNVLCDGLTKPKKFAGSMSEAYTHYRDVIKEKINNASYRVVEEIDYQARNRTLVQNKTRVGSYDWW